MSDIPTVEDAAAAVSSIPGITDLAYVAEGSYGVVFRGREEDPGRDVAVKVLKAGFGPGTRIRFQRERQALGRLSDHPGIVPIHRHGTLHPGAHPYIVMAWAGGGSLGEELRVDGPVGWSAALEIGALAADALAFAHSQGILHRDVKPANLLRTRTGHVLVSDFGIAHIADMTAMTPVGATPGTFGYLDPSVLRGAAQAGPASDVFSLAATLHVLATGRPVLGGETAFEAIARANAYCPPAIDVEDARVAAVISRALDPHQEGRPNMRELAAALAGERPRAGSHRRPADPDDRVTNLDHEPLGPEARLRIAPGRRVFGIDTGAEISVYAVGGGSAPEAHVAVEASHRPSEPYADWTVFDDSSVVVYVALDGSVVALAGGVSSRLDVPPARRAWGVSGERLLVEGTDGRLHVVGLRPGGGVERSFGGIPAHQGIVVVSAGQRSLALIVEEATPYSTNRVTVLPIDGGTVSEARWHGPIVGVATENSRTGPIRIGAVLASGHVGVAVVEGEVTYCEEVALGRPLSGDRVALLRSCTDDGRRPAPLVIDVVTVGIPGVPVDGSRPFPVSIAGYARPPYAAVNDVDSYFGGLVHTDWVLSWSEGDVSRRINGVYPLDSVGWLVTHEGGGLALHGDW